MANETYEGSYENVKDDSFVAYLIKAGVPKDEAEKMKGTHWFMRLEYTKDGRWVVYTKVDEMPECNGVVSFKEGVEKELDHPLFGGKAKIFFVREGKDSFRCKATSEKYGITEWTEKYSEDGITFNCVHKGSGATYTEKWRRKYGGTGWYRCVKFEGVEEYTKATKPPIEYDPNMEMKVGFEKCGDVYSMTEIFGKHSIVTRIKLDEEMTYAPGTPFEGKLLCTKIKERTYRFIYVTSRGEENWDMTFCSKGLTYNAVHKPTGATCKMFFENFHNIFGTYKMVSCHNMVELGTAMGMSADFCTKLANECDARLENIDEGDGWVHTKYHSKFMPMDFCFKFNEEFDFSMPAPGMPPIQYKVLATKEADTVVQMWCNDQATICTTMKFTGNWIIETDRIVGTDIWAKTILKRC